MRRDPAIILLGVGETLAWASIYYLFPALLLRWETDLGWSKAELTGAIASAVLVSAVASPLAGRLIDAGRAAQMFAASAVLGGVGLVLLSLVTELWQFYAVWILIGLAMAGCLYEPCFALVTRARGKDAKPAIIVITLMAGFASTISFPAVYSLATALGWRGAALVGAGTMIFVVAPILWTGVRWIERDSIVVPATPQPDGMDRSFLSGGAFWLLALGFTCLALAHGATLHHLLPILDERRMSPETAVLAASFIGPMQVAGRLAMMASQRHITHHGMAVAAFGGIALSLGLLLDSSASPAFLSAFVILFGGCYGTVSILRPLLARDILGDKNFGAKSGALALPYLAGSAVAPFAGALVWRVGGYDSLLVILIALLGVGAALYAWADRMARAR